MSTFNISGKPVSGNSIDMQSEKPDKANELSVVVKSAINAIKSFVNSQESSSNDFLKKNISQITSDEDKIYTIFETVIFRGSIAIKEQKLIADYINKIEVLERGAKESENNSFIKNLIALKISLNELSQLFKSDAELLEIVLKKNIYFTSDENDAINPLSDDELKSKYNNKSLQNCLLMQDKDDLSRNLAHIFGDFFIRGDSRFEGNSRYNSLLLLESILLAFYSGDAQEKKSITKEIIEDDVYDKVSVCKEIGKILDAASYYAYCDISRIDELSKECTDAIIEAYWDSNVEEGKSLFIPGGYPRHAMLYEIVKDENSYTLKIYNSGNYLQYHPAISLGDKYRYKTCIEYRDFTKDDMIKTVGELITISIASKRIQTTSPYSGKDIYDGVLANRSATIVDDDHGLMTMQRSGTCTWRCLMALMLNKFKKPENYRLWEFLVRMRFLGEATSLLLSNDKFFDKNNAMFLRKGSEHLANTVVNLLHEKIIGNDIAVEALRLIKTVIKHATDKERVDIETISLDALKIESFETKDDTWSNQLNNIGSLKSINNKYNFTINKAIVTKSQLAIMNQSYSIENCVSKLQTAVEYCSSLRKNGMMLESACYARNELLTMPSPRYGADDLWNSVKDKEKCLDLIDSLSKSTIESSMDTHDHLLASYSAYAITHKLACCNNEKLDQYGIYYKPLVDFALYSPIPLSAIESKKFNELKEYFTLQNNRKDLRDFLNPQAISCYKESDIYQVSEYRYITDVLKKKYKDIGSQELKIHVLQILASKQYANCKLSLIDINKMDKNYAMLRGASHRCFMSAYFNYQSESTQIRYGLYSKDIDKGIPINDCRILIQQFYNTYKHFTIDGFDDKATVNKVYLARNENRQRPNTSENNIMTRLKMREQELSLIHNFDTLQITCYLEDFKESWERIKDPQERIHMLLSFFESDILTLELKDETDIASQLLKFIEAALKKYGILRNMDEHLFLLHTFQWLHDYVFININDAKILDSYNKFWNDNITNLRNIIERTEDNKIKNSYYRQLILFHCSCAKTKKLDSDSIKDILQGYINIVMYGNKDNNALLEHELLTKYTAIIPYILENSSELDLNDILKSVLELYIGKQTESSSVVLKYPFFIISNGKEYIYNIANGFIYIDKAVLIAEYSQFISDKIYNKVFGHNKIYNVLERKDEYGSLSATFSDSHGEIKIHAEKNNTITQIEGNINSKVYIYVSDIDKINIPRPLLCYSAWYNSDSKQITFFDEKMDAIYELNCEKFEITRVSDQSKLINLWSRNKNSAKNLIQFKGLCSQFILSSDEKISENQRRYPSYSFEEANYVLALKNSSDICDRIEFPRYRDARGSQINFTLRDDRWRSSIDPRYYIADNKDSCVKNFLDKNKLVINGFDRFVVITDGVNYKVIMPRMHISYSNSKEYEIISFTLNDDAVLYANNSADSFYLAYVSLYYKAYGEALTYINSGLKSTIYSPEELSTCQMLLHSLEENQDHDPDCASIRIYVSYMIYSSYRTMPAEIRLSSEYKDLSTYYNRWLIGEGEDGKTGLNFWSDLRHSLMIYYDASSKVSISLDFNNLIDPILLREFLHQLISPCIVQSEELPKLHTICDREEFESAQKEHGVVVSIDGQWKPLISHDSEEPIINNMLNSISNDMQYSNELMLRSLDREYSGHREALTSATVRKIFFETSTLTIDNILKKPTSFWLRPGYGFPQMFLTLYNVIREGKHLNEIEHLLFLTKHEADNEKNYYSIEKQNKYLAQILHSALKKVKNNSLEHKLPSFDAIKSNKKDEDRYGYFVESCNKIGFEPLVRRQPIAANSYLSVAGAHNQNISKALNTAKVTYESYHIPKIKNKCEIKQDLPSFSDAEDYIAKIGGYSEQLYDGYFIKSEVNDGCPEKINFDIEGVIKGMGNTKPTKEFVDGRLNNLNEDAKMGFEMNREAKISYILSGISFKKLEDKLNIFLVSMLSIEKSYKEAILTLVNKKNDDINKHLVDQLQIYGSKKKQISMQMCCQYFIQDDKVFTENNSNLTKYDISQLRKMLTTYMVVKTQYQQINRSKKLIKKIMSLPNSADEEYKLTINQLALEMSAKRHYSYKENPELLLFEAHADMILRETQVKIIKEFFKEGCSQPIERQLVMGSGKSKVLGIIAAAKKADGEKLSLSIVPKSLYETNSIDMKKASEQCFGQQAHSINFNRSLELCTCENINHIYITLSKAIASRDYVIMTRESIQNLELEFYAELEMYEYVAEDIQEELKQKIYKLSQILSLIKNKGSVTIDELDTVLDVRRVQRFTLGNPDAVIKSEHVDVISDIFECFLSQDIKINGRAISDIIDLSSKEQVMVAKKEYDVVKKAVAQKFYEKMLSKLATIDLLEGVDISSLNSNKIKKEMTYYISGQVIDKIPESLVKMNDGEYKNIIIREDVQKAVFKNFAEQITLARKIINEILPEALNRKVDEHFGLSKKNINNRLAIPFDGGAPHDGANFADHNETVCKTYRIYLRNGIESHNVEDYIAYLQSRYEELNNSNGLEKDAVNNLFLKQFGDIFSKALLSDVSISSMSERNQHDIKNKVVARIKELINKKEMPLLFCKYIGTIAKKYKYHTKQISSTASDFRSIFTLGIQGYSGTANVSPENRDRELGRITAALLQSENKSIMSCNKCDIETVLDLIFSDDVHGKSPLHAFIDIGAQFTGNGNYEFSCGLLSAISKKKSAIKGVLYFDTISNCLMAVKHGEKDPIFIGSTSPDMIEDATGLKRSELFTYYDRLHITGIDIKQPSPSMVAVFIADSTTLTDLYQGVMRARGLINGTQNVQFIIPEKFQNVIKRTLGLAESDSLSMANIIAYVEIKDCERRSENGFREKLQQIFAVVKSSVLSVMLNNKDRQIIFNVFKNGIFIHNLTDNFFKQYLHHSKDCKPEDVLKTYGEQCLKLFEQGFNTLDEEYKKIFNGGIDHIKNEINNIIESKLIDNSMPAIVKSNDTILECDQSVEQQQQMEVENKVEEQVSSQGYIPTPKRDSGWNIDINNSAIFNIIKNSFSRVEMPITAISSHFDSVYMSKNFTETFTTEAGLISDKILYHILAVYDKKNNKELYVIVSQNEASDIKKKLETQKDTDVCCALLRPDGNFVKKGENFDKKQMQNFDSRIASLLFLMGHEALKKPGNAVNFLKWVEDIEKSGSYDVVKHKSLFIDLSSYYKNKVSYGAISNSKSTETDRVITYLMSGNHRSDTLVEALQSNIKSLTAFGINTIIQNSMDSLMYTDSWEEIIQSLVKKKIRDIIVSKKENTSKLEYDEIKSIADEYIEAHKEKINNIILKDVDNNIKKMIEYNFFILPKDKESLIYDMLFDRSLNNIIEGKSNTTLNDLLTNKELEGYKNLRRAELQKEFIEKYKCGETEARKIVDIVCDNNDIYLLEALSNQDVKNNKDIYSMLVKSITKEELFIKAACENISIIQYPNYFGDNIEVLKKIAETRPEVINEYLDKEHRSIAVELANSNDECALAAIKKDPSFISKIDEKWRTDVSFAEQALKSNYKTLEYLDDSLRGDKDFMLERIRFNKYSCEECVSIFNCATDTLKKDEDFLGKAAYENINIVSRISSFGDNIEVLKKIAETRPEVVNYYLDKNRDMAVQLANSNDKCALAAIQKDPSFISKIDEKWRTDVSFAEQALKSNYQALGYLDDSLRGSKDFVLKRIRSLGCDNACFIYPYVTDSVIKAFSTDEEFLLEAIKTAPGFYWLAGKLKEDKDLFIKAACENISIIQYPNYFGDNIEVLKKIAETRPEVINEYLDKEHRSIAVELANSNDECALAAIKKDPSFISKIDEKWRTDVSFAEQALKSNYKALEYLAESLRGDKDFVLKMLKDFNDINSIQGIFDLLPTELKKEESIIQHFKERFQEYDKKTPLRPHKNMSLRK